MTDEDIEEGLRLADRVVKNPWSEGALLYHAAKHYTDALRQIKALQWDVQHLLGVCEEKERVIDGLEAEVEEFRGKEPPCG